MGGGRDSTGFLNTEGGGRERSGSGFLTGLLGTGTDRGPWAAGLLTLIVVETAFLSIVDVSDPGV